MTDSTGTATDWIYDVGMHNGDDTAFYLHQGFNVIAIEANTQLADLATRRFCREVKSGRLTILNVGVAELEGTGTFWICDNLSVRSSLQENLACRDGEKHHSIQIQTRRFAGILDRYGVPYYLKIDIEGSDYLCLRDLSGRSLPKFISVEAEYERDDDEVGETDSCGNLDLLYKLGYRRFKLIGQSDLRAAPESDLKAFVQRLVKSAAYGRLRFPAYSQLAQHLTGQAKLYRKYRYRFSFGSNGAWGEGTPGSWLSFEHARALHLRASRRYSKNDGKGFWYDWHAAV
jgi:FkbM family methyltransferase